jgi:hypothetical protein
MANAILHVPAFRGLGYGVNGGDQHSHVVVGAAALKAARETEKLAVADVAVHHAASALLKMDLCEPANRHTPIFRGASALSHIPGR